MLDEANFFTRQRFQSALSFYMHTNESTDARRTLVVEPPNFMRTGGSVVCLVWQRMTEGEKNISSLLNAGVAPGNLHLLL